jgi:hypothetical protein
MKLKTIYCLVFAAVLLLATNCFAGDYLYKDFVVVFVGVFTRGFEGPDMRFMAVTGTLK